MDISQNHLTHCHLQDTWGQAPHGDYVNQELFPSFPFCRNLRWSCSILAGLYELCNMENPFFPSRVTYLADGTMLSKRLRMKPQSAWPSTVSCTRHWQHKGLAWLESVHISHKTFISNDWKTWELVKHRPNPYINSTWQCGALDAYQQ